MQEDIHIFQGMRRDSHPIKQDRQFLWDAHNIRLTTRDGNSMLSITNEKSTRELIEFNSQELYIGHCVVGDYLVLFTKDTSVDTIYRINLDTLNKVILYTGDLGFDHSHPIQAISDYEAELIQKVYWVDGKNRVRVINIVKPELLGVEVSDNYTDIYKDAPFDFVQELSLEEDIKVDRIVGGGGLFSSGVIQYAFTYYYKYGQESNIFYTTEPMYVSYQDRGGSPESALNNAFSITVKHVDKKFQYLRIYSIFRTSVDSTPLVKRVADISLEEPDRDEISYIDTNTTGDTVDPSMLLYIGGKDIVAGCIESKDSTLFLGNIEYRRKEASSISNLKKYINQLIVASELRTEVVSSNETYTSKSGYYNQLSKNTSTFKTGEQYRLGIQFQYKNGEWSEPMFIRDVTMPISERPKIVGSSVMLPTFISIIPPNIKATLIKEGYVKARPLVVLPSNKDKLVLAQGVLCPTVFNAGNRESNSPFSQSSWFLRPFLSSDPELLNNLDITSGAAVEFKHYCPLLNGFNRGAEVQNMFLDTDAKGTSVGSNVDTLDSTLLAAKNAFAEDTRNDSYKALYYIDQSILTFHSPDIELNDSLYNGTLEGCKVRLVGIVPFSSNYGDIDIQVSSVVADPKASGFMHRSIINNLSGSRSLVSGLFYEDSTVDDKGVSTFSHIGDRVGWMIYPWHRSGSLNNDCVRPGGEARTSVLKKKVISNLKSSIDNEWLQAGKLINLSTSELQLVNSNEVFLTKISDSNNKTGDITYYGNVDSMNVSYSPFRIIKGSNLYYQINGTNGDPKLSGTITTIFNGLTYTGAFEDLEFTPKLGNWALGYLIVTLNESQEIVLHSGNVSLAFNIASGSEIKINIDTAIEASRVRKYTGIISDEGTTYYIEGETDFLFNTKGSPNKAFDFSASLLSVDSKSSVIGGYQSALKLPKDQVRIKYKSTPHVVFATQYNKGARQPLPYLSGTDYKDVSPESIYWLEETPTRIIQETVSPSDLGLERAPSAYLWLAEIYRPSVENAFGGYSTEALQNNLWIPAGPPIRLDSEEYLTWKWGDTWYQRYDCLKTYSFTQEDENQVVEIGSFMCETRVNIDGRYDRNRDQLSNLNMSPINFNLVNPVYSQKNTFFNYRILDSDYYKTSTYPSQLMWSTTKSPASIQDAWTNLTAANTLDLDGSYGALTSIQRFNDLLLGFQETGIQQILFNSRVQIQATDGVPIEIANSQKIDGVRTYNSNVGCQDKFSIVTSPMGVYFIDNNNNSAYLFNGEFNELSLQLGSLYWFRDNYSDMSWRFTPKVAGNNGIRLYYDTKHKDVYFVPGSDYLKEQREALCYSEILGQFTSNMSYGGAVMFSHKSKFYSIAKDWVSDTLKLWENFPEESISYNNIFNKIRPFSISFISNDNPTINKVFDTIEMRADSYDKSVLLGSNLTHVLQDGQPLDFIRVTNEYQDTGITNFDSSNLRKKFRAWRALFPRNKGTRERIRNVWAKVTLGMNSPGTKMTILHDLSVKYTI